MKYGNIDNTSKEAHNQCANKAKEEEEMVYTREHVISPHLQLSFLSDRVVNLLSGECPFSYRDKQVFEKAMRLLDSALDGSEIVRTGRLKAGATTHLGVYGVTVHTYAALAQNRKMSQREDLQQVIKSFRQDLDDLAQGTAKDKDRIQIVKEFFTLMRDISLRSDRLTFDKVKIGR